MIAGIYNAEEIAGDVRFDSHLKENGKQDCIEIGITGSHIPQEYIHAILNNVKNMPNNTSDTIN